MCNSPVTITTVTPTQLAADSTLYASYLAQFDLPTDNVIASTEQRNIIATNLPVFFDSLSKEQKKDAHYLAKFTGAAAVGLFDAALNYIWNEVVLALRKKAIIYGIELFFDSAIGGKNRDSYKDESDLGGLKDSVLLHTCNKLELISKIVYVKLNHILIMRNELAASHPNVEQIDAFELMSWLQICVKDILHDQPSESAIQIRKLITNLKERTTIIEDNSKEHFVNELKNLSLPHVHNLLVTLFGLFVRLESSQILRKNISIVAPYIWDHSEDRVKCNIGQKIDGFRTNLDERKLQRAQEFLTLVGGRSFESLPARTIALQVLVEQLQITHNDYNNFYNEPPIMGEILSYCKQASDIPKPLLPTLVATILMCRLGRGLSYKKGVSPAGKPLYDQFLRLLDDNGVTQCLIALYHTDLKYKIGQPYCSEHLVTILEILQEVAISDRIKDILGFILTCSTGAHRAGQNNQFIELTRGIFPPG